MGIGSGTAALIGGLVGAGGSVASGIMGSNAAQDAASQQAAAANHAADLQYQASQNALGFQEGQYANSQAELAPYLQSGSQALSNLNYLLGNGQAPSQSGTGTTATGTNGGAGSPISVAATPNTSLGAEGSLLAAYPGGAFTAPTAEQAAQTPGYQFQLQQGQQALQQSAAARGNLLTGGTAEALDNYSQGLAASNYQNVYNNALNTYGTNYNAYQQQQQNEYNRLASLAGVGQTTAGQLSTLGQNTANSVSSNLLGTASQIGQDYQNAGAANASGIVGSSNALGGAITGGTNSLSQLALLQSILGGGGGLSGIPGSAIVGSSIG